MSRGGAIPGWSARWGDPRLELLVPDNVRRMTHKEKTDRVAAFTTTGESLPSETSDVMIRSVFVLVMDGIDSRFFDGIARLQCIDHGIASFPGSKRVRPAGLRVKRCEMDCRESRTLALADSRRSRRFTKTMAA